MMRKSLKKITLISLTVGLLNACSGQSALDITRALLGYIPPPEETSIGEELKLEYERCVKIGSEPNCAQAAYDVVRTVKGLEPRKVPKGVVIILEGHGGHFLTEEEKRQQAEEERKEKEQEEK